jgi:hypothetical protein
LLTDNKIKTTDLSFLDQTLRKCRTKVGMWAKHFNGVVSSADTAVLCCSCWKISFTDTEFILVILSNTANPALS